MYEANGSDGCAQANVVYLDGMRPRLGHIALALVLLVQHSSISSFGSSALPGSGRDNPRNPEELRSKESKATQGTPSPRYLGMNFAHAMGATRGYGTPASLASLRELRSLGVRSVAVTPFGFQRRATDSEIVWVGSGGRFIDETDDSIREVIAQAHSLGMTVMLKPHIWLRPPDWPGSIAPTSPQGWRTWFKSYRAFILHYAAIAETNHVELLCIGNELTRTSAHEAEWRELIKEIRSAYRGQLTYGSNLQEVYDVPFWDALDYIGLSAYFPLASGARPGMQQIESGWAPISMKLAALSARTHRSILFTEIGYSSREHALEKPWEEDGGAPNSRVQEDAYEAFFRSVWKEPWLAGAFFWKWESYPSHANADDGGFHIENKPAAEVMKKYFARERILQSR